MLRVHHPAFNITTFNVTTFNVQCPPSNVHHPAFNVTPFNVQRATFNVHHPMSTTRHPTFNVTTFNLTTFNLQPSTFNLQRPTFNLQRAWYTLIQNQSTIQELTVPYVPVPTIVERTPRGERSWDLFSRLLQERIIMLGTPIDDEVASLIVAQLLYLQHTDPDRDIWFYINSPGGSVRDGLAIYDTMKLISPDVCTVCVGRAGSMATILLAGGARGKRYALPHATIHFHPAGGGAEGYAPDMERMVKELLRIQELGNGLLARDTGKTIEEITRDFSRDRFMTAEEAREYGFIDAILESKKVAALKTA
jgi:ATP-dependent Clp protease protease subunit